MFYVRKIDGNGYFIEDAFVDSLTDENGNPIPAYVETPCPDGFYLPKWDGAKWVEGGTAPPPTPPEPTTEERVSALETLYLQAEGII